MTFTIITFTVKYTWLCKRWKAQPLDKYDSAFEIEFVLFDCHLSNACEGL